MYIHERQKWPELTWDNDRVGKLLAEVRHRQGRLLGRMESLGFPLQESATLQALTQDVVKTSEIEGEKLDLVTVRSSIARRMGVDIGATAPIDRNVEAIVEIMMDATTQYHAPLTEERLFGWHAALFPTGRTGMRRITVGGWRTAASGAMQVISGPIGRERVHFEAPEAARLKKEMKQFIKWFNQPSETDPVLRAALAHFWFVTIHPFEDGNGRIARALADMLLARSEQTSHRFYSMSAEIQRQRDAYYTILERSQKGALDITAWMEWFLHCLNQAIEASESTLQTVLAKARFWEKHADQPFNDRQKKLLNRLLDGFQGKLTSSKWAKIAKCSQDTAGRDINELISRKILKKEEAGGRSTSYVLVT